MADQRRDAEIRLKVTGAKEAAAAQEELAAGQRKVAESVKEADAAAGGAKGTEQLADATKDATEATKQLKAGEGDLFDLLRRGNPVVGNFADGMFKAARIIETIGASQLSFNTIIAKGTELVKAHAGMLMTLGAGGAAVAAIMYLISVIGHMEAAWERVQEATRKARMELIAYQEQQELTAQSIENIADRMRMEGMGVEETRAAKIDFEALRQRVAEQVSDETIKQAIVAVGAVGDVAERRTRMEQVSYGLYAGGQLPSGAQYAPGRESAVQELLTVFGERIAAIMEREAAQRFEVQRAAAEAPTAESTTAVARIIAEAFPEMEEERRYKFTEMLQTWREDPQVRGRAEAAIRVGFTTPEVGELMRVLTRLEATLSKIESGAIQPRVTNVFHNARLEQGPRLERVRTGGRYAQEAELQ